MNDGVWGAQSPGVPAQAEGRWRASTAASASWRVQRPLPLSRPLQLPWTGDWWEPQEGGGRAVGGARGRLDLVGVSGLGCEGGGAASLVALTGLAQRRRNKAGADEGVRGRGAGEHK
jgi:hypothetical protein